MKKFFLIFSLMLLIVSSINVLAIVSTSDNPASLPGPSPNPEVELRKSLTGQVFTWTAPNGNKIKYMYCPKILPPKCPNPTPTNWLIATTNAPALPNAGGQVVLDNLNQQVETKVIELMAEDVGRVLASLPNNEDTSVCYNDPRKSIRTNKCLERDDPSSRTLIGEFTSIPYAEVETYSIDADAVTKSVFDRGVGFYKIAELKKQYEGVIKFEEVGIEVPPQEGFLTAEWDEVAGTATFRLQVAEEQGVRYRLTYPNVGTKPSLTRVGAAMGVEINTRDFSKPEDKIDVISDFNKFNVEKINAQEKVIARYKVASVSNLASGSNTGPIDKSIQMKLLWSKRGFLQVDVEHAGGSNPADVNSYILKLKAGNDDYTVPLAIKDKKGFVVLSDNPLVKELKRNDYHLFDIQLYVVKRTAEEVEVYDPVGVYFDYIRYGKLDSSDVEQSPDDQLPSVDNDPCKLCGDAYDELCTADKCRALSKPGITCVPKARGYGLDYLGLVYCERGEAGASPAIFNEDASVLMKKYCTPAVLQNVLEVNNINIIRKKLLDEEVCGDKEKNCIELIKEIVPGDINRQIVLAGIVATESGGEKIARNPKTDCVGLTQFCPVTAWDFGLCDCKLSDSECRKIKDGDIAKTTGVFCVDKDDRMDPRKNLEAAVKLMDRSAKTLKTDPDCRNKIQSGKNMLVYQIAAHNRGAGGVCRTIAGTGKTDPSFDDIAKSLPTETKCYVPKVLFYTTSYADLLGVRQDLIQGKCEDVCDLKPCNENDCDQQAIDLRKNCVFKDNVFNKCVEEPFPSDVPPPVTIAVKEFEKVWEKGTKLESQSEMAPVVKNYYNVAGCAGLSPTNDAWSAAFISYVMVRGGVGTFPESCAHINYFKSVKENPRGCTTYPMAKRQSIKVGDIVCSCRGANCNVDYNTLPLNFVPTHCDIVVSRNGNEIELIGGNRAQAGGNANLGVTVAKSTTKISNLGSSYFGFISCNTGQSVQNNQAVQPATVSPSVNPSSVVQSPGEVQVGSQLEIYEGEVYIFDGT
ncbi:MAG: DUF2272 domain-containing protein, partial [Candidatus Nanoarchaeia archaeon]